MGRQREGFYIWDQSHEVMEGDVLIPFAQEEWLCRKVNTTGMPIVHLWRHRRAVVLGLRDRKLPFAVQAIHDLQNEGYAVAVRNSGGAAVPLDDGVLNVTLILPRATGVIDFRHDFAKMAETIRGCVQTFGLRMEIGEVRGSYCPGEYDLHVGGRKFCGLAQRRPVGAISVQAFIVVEGSGNDRLQLIRDYYEHAAGGRQDIEYPRIRLGSVASLQELASEQERQPMEMDRLRRRLLAQFSETYGDSVPLVKLRPDPSDVATIVEQFRSRYDK